MKKSHHYLVGVSTTGLLVLLVYCLCLFCCRVFSQALSRGWVQVQFRPSGLVRDDIENDPNTVSQSWLRCELMRIPEWIFFAWDDGAFDDWWHDNFIRDRSGSRAKCVQVLSAREEDGWAKRAWQPKTGQFVETLYIEKKTKERYVKWDQRVSAYVGPLGFSAQQTKALGRFHDPLVAEAAGSKDALIVYDRKQRCFFRVDFADRLIKQGPEIPSALSILQIGDVSKNGEFLSIRWHAPERLETEQEKAHRLDKLRRRYGEGHLLGPGGPYGAGPGMMDPRYMDMMGGMDPNTPQMGLQADDQMEKALMPPKSIAPQRVAMVEGRLSDPRGMVLVLGASGRIYKLDEEALALSPPLGRFPKLKHSKLNTLRSTLAHQIKLFYEAGEYAGCVVTNLSKDGTDLGASVFDKSGNWVPCSSERNEWHHDPDSLLRSAARAAKSATELLHPLGLHLLSLAFGAEREALLSHRSPFMQSSSFVANTLHDTENDLVTCISHTLFWFSMPTALGIFLAWLIVRDLRRLGLSGSFRTHWTVAALAFGPVAYITYRITRPDPSLVTCPNCGRLRRVDQDQCHECKAAWAVPELNAPAWRVT